MAGPNPQLEAALLQFEQQPGVTKQQKGELRATLQADGDLLQRMNNAASNGQLHGFALPAAADASEIGRYDKASGVITLPASSLHAGSGAASVELRGSLRLQEASLRFAHSQYTDAAGVTKAVPQDAIDNLQATINGSPQLARQMRIAVTTTDTGQPGHKLLENFNALSGTVAGGTYDQQANTINLPMVRLAMPPATFQLPSNASELTFVLGHETQHALNTAVRDTAYHAFAQAARTIASDNNPVNDYTVPIRQLLDANRQDESMGQIAGWNALHGRKSAQLGIQATLNDMATMQTKRTDDFIQASSAGPHMVAKPGLQFSTDGSLAMTSTNIAAQGQLYFDKPPQLAGPLSQQTTGIGFHGTSDYPNYYGAHAVSQAILAERTYAHPVNGVPPSMRLNMQQLGLREDLLEANGIRLPAASVSTPQAYLDVSTTPPKPGLFQHTIDTHQHVNPVQPSRLYLEAEAQNARIQPSPQTQAPAMPSRPSLTPEDRDHPDHALLEKIRAGVRDLDRQAGKSWDASSDRIAASALALAVERGFTAEQDIRVGLNEATSTYAAGEILHVYRAGHPNPDPAAQRHHMRTNDALASTPDERYQHVESLHRQFHQTLTQPEAAQRQQAEAMDTPVRTLRH